MKLNKIKSIKISLMEAQSDINEKTSKAEYLTKASATFNITQELLDMLSYNEEDFTESLLESMFKDLIEQNPEVNIDTVGMWIDIIDNGIKENAIKLETLKNMQEYSVEEITPIYELFKLTLDV